MTCPDMCRCIHCGAEFHIGETEAELDRLGNIIRTLKKDCLFLHDSLHALDLLQKANVLHQEDLEDIVKILKDKVLQIISSTEEEQKK